MDARFIVKAGGFLATCALAAGFAGNWAAMTSLLAFLVVVVLLHRQARRGNTDG